MIQDQRQQDLNSQNQSKLITLQEPSLDQLLNQLSPDHKISAVPLEFQYLPVELLSKEFTKFNNPHKYRIHYLGPRPLNSFILHKKYGSIQYQPNSTEPVCSKDYNKYDVNLRKIVQSNFINQGLRTNCHYKNAIFYRAFEGMNPTLNLKQQIIFNSAFQSGNLDCVIKPKQDVFDLFLRIDSNTRGHTQWYYFSIKNGKKDQTIKINICNITKGKTLYECGMRPYIFSRKMKEKFQSGYSWEQGGQKISFQPKPLRYQLVYQNAKVTSLHELSFQYTFNFDEDQVFFAYSVPYTYSQLLYTLSLFNKQNVVRKSILGKTFTGVDIPILHITNFNESNQRKEKKKSILITGRIHPGQSNSSHMINGFISFLLSDTQEAIQLRNRVNFFIVPMANPDGVIMGNSRTSAAGKDLNRQFKSYKFELYPEVYLIKNLALKLKKKYSLFMYLDFHGHSRKKNTFFYGPPYSLSDAEYYKCRAFPRLLQKLNSSFRFYGCSFGLSDEKRKTGRGVMFQQIKIPYTYTIQSSIGLYYDFEGKLTVQFEQNAWTQMGKNIGTALSNFVVLQQEYEQSLRQRIAARLKARQKNKLSLRMTKQQMEMQEENQQNFKSQFSKYKENYKDNEIIQNPFQKIFDEIKQSYSKIQNFEEDVSSDDHDINQDLQASKLNQFNNLIVQSIQKQLGSYTNKYFAEDELLTDFPSKQLQSKGKQSSVQLKNTKNQSSNGISQNASAKFRNRQVIAKSQSIKIKQSTSLKKTVQILSPLKIEKRSAPKNFVMANKQKYSIATKNFLINENNRYEIIELPKNIQNIRKQLTKGRILINNLFQNKLRTQKQKQPDQNQILVSKQGQSDRKLSTSSRFRRNQIKQSRGNPFIYTNSLDHQLVRRSSTSQMNRQAFTYKQNPKFIPNRKRTIDNMDYDTFADIELDNFAMTIKSFKGF